MRCTCKLGILSSQVYTQSNRWIWRSFLVFSSTQSDKQSIIRYYGEFYNVRIEMGRLNDARRHEAIGMIRGGAPKCEDASQMGCSHQTIPKRIQRYNGTGSVKDRQRPGRQRVKSVRQYRQKVITHLRDRFRTATQTARDTIGVFKRRISASTVIRRLRQTGLRTHTPFRGNVLTPNCLSKQGGLVQTSCQMDATWLADIVFLRRIQILF